MACNEFQSSVLLSRAPAAQWRKEIATIRNCFASAVSPGLAEEKFPWLAREIRSRSYNDTASKPSPPPLSCKRKQGLREDERTEGGCVKFLVDAGSSLFTKLISDSFSSDLR